MKRISKTTGIALFSIVLLFSNGCISNQEIPRQTDNYKTIIDFQYDSITISPKENFIVVEQDGRFGAYVKANETWELKIPVQYAMIFCRPSEDRVLAAYLDDSHIDLYRSDGSRLLDQTVRSVLAKENGSGMMVSVDNVHVGYLSWTGEWILEPQYTKSILPMDEMCIRDRPIPLRLPGIFRSLTTPRCCLPLSPDFSCSARCRICSVLSVMGLFAVSQCSCFFTTKNTPDPNRRYRFLPKQRQCAGHTQSILQRCFVSALSIRSLCKPRTRTPWEPAHRYAIKRPMACHRPFYCISVRRLPGRTGSGFTQAADRKS